MKKLFCVLCFVVTTAVVTAATIEIRPVADKVWKVGEKVDFTVRVLDKGGKLLKTGSYLLHVTNSGGKELCKPYKVDAASQNPFRFSARLDVPGFLMVRSPRYISADGKKSSWENSYAANPPICGVPVEPEKIRPGSPAPQDLDRFWQEGIERFKAAKVTVVPEKNVRMKGYKVSRITVEFPDGSGAIDGFLSVPLKAGKYPVIFSIPGAGPGSVGAASGYGTGSPAVHVSMNVHKFPTASTAAEQKKRYIAYEKSFPDKKSYILSQAHDREKYIFRNVWLAMSRAADHVAASVKEYDGKNFAFVGSSQGGGTALALCYLNKNASCAVANVPAFCDNSGWRAGRMPEGPKFYNYWNKKADESVRYFDCANFAPSIKVPVLLSAGFGDTQCSPSSVYAAYNRLKGPKRLFPMLRAGHIARKDFNLEARKFLRKQFGL